MEEKVIEALNELKLETEAICNSFTLTDWKNKAINIIVRIYGHDSLPQKQIENLKYSLSFEGGSNVNERKGQASQLIDGLIKEIEHFGLPPQLKKEKEGMHINITQTSNQQTKINLSLIIESIQDELKGAQLKALQEIIEDKGVEAEEKKVRIIEKLKSFGSDIASNIVASILTNPALFG
tara:strand:- start:135 stop:674 length:540 start_codon:yes stop_codon:yes gene_type:complete